ncbi:MAG: energy-coupled thiamine transporter ThiT [Bacilli bacterium]
MKNKSIRFITEIGIFSALGLILDFIAGLYSDFIFPGGGSISITMVTIFIVAFRWGLKGGLTVGLLIGLLQLPYSDAFKYGLHWSVVLGIVFLDYIFAYTACGLAGAYAKKARETDLHGTLGYVTSGILLAAGVRTLLHITSGWIFFRQWVPEFIREEYAWYYWSIIYNLGYMVPSTILCILITRGIVRRYHEKLFNVETFMFG